MMVIAVSIYSRLLPRKHVPKVNYTASRSVGIAVCALWIATSFFSAALAQKQVKRPPRATPPSFKPNEFSGIFFEDALAQLQGERPASNGVTIGSNALADGSSSKSSMGNESVDSVPAAGNSAWKNLISGATIEDLVKESKSRLDKVVTTPAKFAGGGFADARREFTLNATLMAIIAQYPEDIRWKNSAAYSQRIFARMASNCKVGTQPVYNEAKQRHQDLADLLKGSKLTGAVEEVTWADTADRGPSMQLLEWALREHLAPITSNDKQFKDGQEEVLKYAEVIAAFGLVLQQEGMTDADDETYVQLAQSMVDASLEVTRATKNGDADGARSAVGKIDQSCIKCHDSYR